MRHHSVETPLMIEYHLNMSKWGSECIYIQSTYLRTTPVCLGITYVCFVPERLPVIRRGPKYQHQYFSSFLSKMLFESHHQNLWNFFLQIENWNGDSKANIDKVQNVLYCEVSSVNPHNPYDAPWGVIYTNNRESFGYLWTMIRRCREKPVYSGGHESSLLRFLCRPWMRWHQAGQWWKH